MFYYLLKYIIAVRIHNLHLKIQWVLVSVTLFYGNNLRASKYITATDAQGYYGLWAEETRQILYTVKGTTDIRWVAHLFCPSSQNYLCNKWKIETFT